MKRVIIALGLVVLVAGIAWAASLVGVSFTDDGLTLTATGVLTGLAAEDAVVTMKAVGYTDRECLNPKGKKPKGHNKGFVKVKAVQEIAAADIVDGEVPIALTTAVPHCPNPKWTETMSTVDFTSSKLTVEQPEGVVVLEVECVFAAPTTDGAVAAGDVVCVETLP